MSQSPQRVASLSSQFCPHAINRRTRVALVNIMDNAEGTEKHFIRTIKKADPHAEITLLRMACTKDDPKYFREQQFLLSPQYQDWHGKIGKDHFDQVIVTGIDRGTLSYDDLAKNYPAFRHEATELFCAIQSSIRSGKTGNVALVCWSGFALMKDLYGVEKGIHSQKFYGLFPHTIQEPRHPLVAGFEDKKIMIPHSRFSFMDEKSLRDTIENHCGKVVLNGPDGPAIWTLENDRITCFINHLEYGIDTLYREHQRDLKNRDSNFPPPQNYRYNPDSTNPELEVVFGELSASCDHFYRNLLTIAREQHDEANKPSHAIGRPNWDLVERNIG